MAVAIKIRDACQLPAHWKSWAGRAADANVVVQIPYRCLPRAHIVKQVVWVAIAVKVGYYSSWQLRRRASWRKVSLEGHSSSQSGGKGASLSARSKLKNVAADQIRYKQIVRAVNSQATWLYGGKRASHSARSKFIDGGGVAAIRQKQIAPAVEGQSKWGSQAGGKSGSFPVGVNL
jgi:hypothetical protein